MNYIFIILIYDFAVGWLAGIGKLLVDETRACDCVCRYGGDEFTVVAPEMKGEGAITRAEKLREILKQTHHNINGDEIMTTISIGIVVYPANCKDANTMIDAADKVLYKAKAAERDCVWVH